VPRERIHHGKLVAKWEATGTSEFPGAIMEATYDPDSKDIPKDAFITVRPSLDVTWTRAGEWVQVSIDVPVPLLHELVSDCGHNPEIISINVVTDILTRSEINNMIRTLRRARDAVYGSDE